MTDDTFRETLLQYFDAIRERVSTESGDWTVKGFIDIYKRIYTISLDTKVLSKVLELLMFPVVLRFADEHDYTVVHTRAQNQYPDITLISKVDERQCFAIDVKTTYRTGVDREGNLRVSGMTLGTFGGYFRTRNRPVSSTFAYDRYLRHYVLGAVYSRKPNIQESTVYEIGDLEDIPSVAHDFTFFLHEKFRIASDGTGSGNTKNIGSSRYYDRLINGSGVFSELGVEIFDDYWMNYQTRAMAKEQGLSVPPYTSLKSYQAHRMQGAGILNIPADQVKSEADEFIDSVGADETENSE